MSCKLRKEQTTGYHEYTVSAHLRELKRLRSFSGEFPTGYTKMMRLSPRSTVHQMWVVFAFKKKQTWTQLKQQIRTYQDQLIRLDDNMYFLLKRGCRLTREKLLGQAGSNEADQLRPTDPR